MIEARKGGPWTWVVDRYIARRVRTHFRAVWLRGALPKADGRGVLAYVNHTNFWDGFLVHQLAKASGHDGYAMMEEQNLSRYRFLSRIGAFSVRRKEGASALQAIRYARNVLARPNTMMFLFPEGEQRPAGVMPMHLERGLEVLARQAKPLCLPIALRYAFFEDEFPDVLVEVGTPHEAVAMDRFTEQLETLTHRLFAAQSPQGFNRLLVGRKSVADRWDAVRGIHEERA